MEVTAEIAFKDVCSFLEKHNPKGIALTPETDLAGELSIDSVGVMDLVMEIEEHFEIDIPMNLLSDVQSLQDLVDVVVRRSAN